MTLAPCGHHDVFGRSCLLSKGHGLHHCYTMSEMAEVEEDNAAARERGVCGYGHLLVPLDVRGIVLDGKATLTIVAAHLESACAGVLVIPLDIDKLPAEDRMRLKQSLLSAVAAEDEEKAAEAHEQELDAIDEILMDAINEDEVRHG